MEAASPALPDPGGKPDRLHVWRRWWPAITGGLVYLLLCAVKSGPMGMVTGQSWQNWWDQAQYLQSAQALAQGNLSPALHWYPLLYSAFAVPFVPILPRNPFLLLDLLCVASIAQSVTRVAGHLGVGRGAALIALFSTCLSPPEIWQAWVAPWTTTLSAALIWWLMAKTGDVLLAPGTSLKPRDAAAIGFCGMLVPLTRPADVVVVTVLVGWLAIVLIRRRAIDIRLAGAAIAGALAPLAAYGLLHFAIYGARPTDYMLLSADLGTVFTDLGWKASVLYLDPGPWFPGSKALLARMPWVAVGVAGWLFVIARPAEPARRLYAACLFAAAGAYVTVLTAYIDFLPSALWRYNSIHYFKWILPLLGLMAWLLVRDGWRYPRVAFAALVAVLTITGLRVLPVPAGQDETARRIDFPLPRERSWEDIYFAQSSVTDPVRAHRNILEYRQIPDGHVVRALALRGSFAPGIVQWQPGGQPGLGWPRDAGSPSLAGLEPLEPVARWKGRLAWAPPCWLFGCYRRPAAS